jgi:hypothetical protein
MCNPNRIRSLQVRKASWSENLFPLRHAFTHNHLEAKPAESAQYLRFEASDAFRLALVDSCQWVFDCMVVRVPRARDCQDPSDHL